MFNLDILTAVRVFTGTVLRDCKCSRIYVHNYKYVVYHTFHVGFQMMMILIPFFRLLNQTTKSFRILIRSIRREKKIRVIVETVGFIF